MKNAEQKLALSQEILQSLTYEAQVAGTTLPMCPNCSTALHDQLQTP